MPSVARPEPLDASKSQRQWGALRLFQVHSNEGPADGGWLCRSHFEQTTGITGSLKGAANASEPEAEKLQKEIAAIHRLLVCALSACSIFEVARSVRGMALIQWRLSRFECCVVEVLACLCTATYNVVLMPCSSQPHLLLFISLERCIVQAAEQQQHSLRAPQLKLVLHSVWQWWVVSTDVQDVATALPA